MTLRVHELATDLGVPLTRVLELLRAMSLPVKSSISTIEMHHADAVRRAFEATTLAPPEQHPSDRHEQVRELLHFTVNGNTREGWSAEQELVRRVNASRQEAASKSRELYESDQLARREANRLRWEGTYEGPREPKHRARALIFQGGAPGLGKRH